MGGASACQIGIWRGGYLLKVSSMLHVITQAQHIEILFFCCNLCFSSLNFNDKNRVMWLSTCVWWWPFHGPSVSYLRKTKSTYLSSVTWGVVAWSPATYVRHRYARHSLYCFFKFLSMYLKRIVGDVWRHVPQTTSCTWVLCLLFMPFYDLTCFACLFKRSNCSFFLFILNSKQTVTLHGINDDFLRLANMHIRNKSSPIYFCGLS